VLLVTHDPLVAGRTHRQLDLVDGKIAAGEKDAKGTQT